MKKSDNHFAPWTKAEVEALNWLQNSGRCHPYTCRHCRDFLGIWFIKNDDGTLVEMPDDFERSDDNLEKIVCLDRELVATENGWICPTCDNIQTWCMPNPIKTMEMFKSYSPWTDLTS